MDPESPVSRMERTLWTFWYYVTEAVNRFLRPEPTDIVSNDPNSSQESAIESEPANHAEGDASGRGVDEELATASLLNPSRPAVAWELCTTDIDLGPDEESIECEAQWSRGRESKVSEEGVETNEEQFTQKESSDAGLPIAKDAKEDKQEENGDPRLYTHGQDEMLKNDEHEEHVSTRPPRLTGDAMSEEIEKSRRKAGDEVETERAMTPDDHQKRDENMGNIQIKEEDDKMHHIDEQDLVAEDTEVKLCTISDLSLEEDDMHIEEAKLQRDEADTELTHEEVQSSDGVLLLVSENENKSDEGARQVENQLSVCEKLTDDNQDLKGDQGFTSLQTQLQMVHNKGGIVPEDELSVVGQEHVMAHRSESDKAEDEKEEEGESTLDEREQGAVIGEENGNEAEKKQTADEVLGQEDTETVTEGRQEEDILTCREKIRQNAETELHTDEFTYEEEEEEDVAKDTEVQTKTRETDDVGTENSDVTTTEISGDGRFFDECQVEEERLSSDIGKKESYMEIECTTTTVEPEGETGQEISGEFQNIAHGICEGQLVVLQELNSPAYEETQEGVPECNNETGPDENTTQWFLEVGDYKEIQTTQLPEEVGRKEPESLQNSPGADYSVVREHMEEKKDNTEDIKNSFDLVVEEHAGIPRLTDAELPQEKEKPLVESVIQESGLFFEEEEEKLSVDSMKTEVEHSEKGFESEVGLKDEADKTTKELQASENENKSDEGARQVEYQLSACEKLSDDNQDLKVEPGFTSLQTQLQMVHNKGGIVPEDELSVVGREHVMAHRSESDKAEDEKEEEGESTLDEREQGALIGEENGNEAEKKQTADEVLEQEDTETVTEGRQEEDILTCREKIRQNAETELHTDEFVYGEEEEDVAKYTEVQTKTRETDDVETENSDVTTTETSGDGRFFDECQIEEERLSSDIGKKESYMEIECTTTTVEPEGETGQEISGEFQNIAHGICEGQLVVLQELNSPAYEETQEGVPECNNETGPDENITQWFLEVGDYKETQTTQLPEEVGRKEPESLQNSPGADYSVVREHMEEKKDNTEDIKNSFDLVVEEHAGIPRLTDAELPQEKEKPLVESVIQESGLFFEEEEEKLSVDSMKTEVKHSEKEFETEVGLRDEADKKTKELQDGTEELLVEFDTDEGLCDSKEVEAAEEGHETTGAAATEVQRMTEISFFQESVDAINSEQNSNTTLSLLDDMTESGFPKQSDGNEPNLLEESAVEIQDAGIDMEETGYRVEEDAAEDEMQNQNVVEMLNLQVTGMAAEVTTGRNEKENSLIAESELSRALEPLETRNLISDEAIDISNAKLLTDVEVADVSSTTESKQQDLTIITTDDMENVTVSEGSHAEETVSSISGHEDVIDEEILDLWLQTALPEDTDGMKQQEVSGQQMDTEIEPSNEEQDGISLVQTEKDKQLVDSYAEKYEVVSDTDMSSSTVESGFLDQSLCEWGTQNNETKLMKSTSTGSIQGNYDLLANMSESANISEFSTQQVISGSQDSLMEETAVTGRSYVAHPDSRAASSEDEHLNQELDKSQERAEKVETETGSRKEIDAEVTDLARDAAWKDTEEADVQSLTEISAPFKVEETKVKDEETKVKDEPLEMSACDSPDEIKHAETRQPISGSETLSVEGNVSESVSQGDTCTESEKLLKLHSVDKPQPGWLEDIADSLPGLNRAEVPTTESGNQMEVGASVLDFTAQRSRIAVKNRRVRPPKDPRSLLHMPSVDPTPSSHLPVKVPPGVPLGGLGIGIKLPGIGAGFPVLKKTRQVVRDENSQENLPQEPETKPEEKSDTPKQEEAQPKPKWMPPKHPGFGNPLMSELKTKLKKTTKE